MVISLYWGKLMNFDPAGTRELHQVVFLTALRPKGRDSERLRVKTRGLSFDRDRSVYVPTEHFCANINPATKLSCLWFEELC